MVYTEMMPQGFGHINFGILSPCLIKSSRNFHRYNHLISNFRSILSRIIIIKKIITGIAWFIRYVNRKKMSRYSLRVLIKSTKCKNNKERERKLTTVLLNRKKKKASSSLALTTMEENVYTLCANFNCSIIWKGILEHRQNIALVVPLHQNVHHLYGIPRV